MELKKENAECQMKKEMELKVKERWHRPVACKSRTSKQTTQEHKERVKSTKQHTWYSETGAHIV